MRTPPLLLAATLAFWGWQTGFLVIGIALGVILEASRWVKVRWAFSDEELNQLWNITVVLFLGAGSYAFATQEGMSAVTGFFGANSFGERSKAMDKAAATVLVFLQWLPMVFFPFVAAQAYSNRARIDFKTFSWFLRRKARRPAAAPSAGGGINTAYPYFAICLVATSTVTRADLVFYAGACLLVAWALWAVRSPRFALPVWLGAVALAAGLGLVGCLVVRDLQQILQRIHTAYVSGFGVRGSDFKESRTAIGQIGRLKGSGRIMLRVEIPPGGQPVTTLREVTYNLYRNETWRYAKPLGMTNDYGPVYPERGETSWLLHNATSVNRVKIAGYLDGGRGLLSAPQGLTRLDNLLVFDLKTNFMGTVRVDSGPGLVSYLAHAGATGSFEAPPNPDCDLHVPENEVPAIAKVAEELRLKDLPAASRPSAIAAFFARKFSYTLHQSEAPASYTNAEIRTPLAHFLLQRRAGHCEFFATATTLLLRQAGIPARYTVGYSVQERAGANKYVVRARHAHAWCVYYDAAAAMWRELDTTPGGWLAAEERNASKLEVITDVFSWIWYQISRVRYGQDNVRQYVFYFLAGVLLLLVIRFVRQKRWRRQRSPGGATPSKLVYPGLDSEFYLIEQKLAKAGCGRRSEEPLRAWLERVREHLPAGESELAALLQLHYRLRFDPKGLEAGERAVLRQQALAWLRRA